MKKIISMVLVFTMLASILMFLLLQKSSRVI